MPVPYIFATQSGNIPLSELDANFSNVSAYTNTAGTVTTAAQPNITSVGSLSSLTVLGGVIGASFTGNGSRLLSINAANITGTVANATYAVTAGTTANATYAATAGVASSANSVAGANVSGTVANATYAVTAGTAYSVNAGNISGTVNLANYANIAYAVAGANVSGTVANATYAVTAGAADSANSVAGANVSGQVANALVSGTVYINAQPSITSVGSLTSLTVAGNVEVINLDVGGILFAGNVNGGNLITAGQVNNTGLEIVGVNYANITANASTTSLSTITSHNILIANNTGYTHTVNMPASPVDGQLTRFTISGNTVILVAGTGNITPTFDGSATAGTGYKYVYRNSNSTWYRTI